MGGDHMCPVCSATFTRPQHVARHMRSHTGDRPYGCQMCGDRFARSDLLSRHVNKCHTPGGLANTTSRRNQSTSRTQAAEDKKRRPCEACTLQSTKCDFGKPCNNCSSRGSKCAYPKAKRPRRNTTSPATITGSLPDSNVSLSQETMPINSFGYQDDVPPFSFSYPPPQDNTIAMPHLYDPNMSVPNPNSSSFIGSPEAPSLSFSAATSDSTESSPWSGLDLMGLNNMPSASFDSSSVFHDPNAPSFTSPQKLQPSLNNNHFGYTLDQPSHPDQLPLTALHQRPGSAAFQRHQHQHHQRHRSSPSFDGSLLNQTLLRAQGQQYPAITPSRLYMHRGSISASDSGTDYESSVGRPGTASEYADFPSPLSLVNSETGSSTGIGRSMDDMSLHDPGASSLLSMGPVMLPGIGMGTGLTPAVESPSRPSMTQRQSTLGDFRTFWNDYPDGRDSSIVSNGSGNGENRNHSLAKMTSMPCLKTPLGDATPRASAADPLSRVGGHRPQSSASHTPRVVNHTDPKSLEQYQSALNARPAPSLHLAPKMKAAAAKQEESESNQIKTEHSFAAPFPPGTAQGDAWQSLMSSSGSYVADSGRPNYKRLPSQTLGPENSKRANHGDGDGSGGEDAVFTDDEDENGDASYRQAQQEWHRRMSLPVMGRSGNGSGMLHQPMPVPASRQGVLN